MTPRQKHITAKHGVKEKKTLYFPKKYFQNIQLNFSKTKHDFRAAKNVIALIKIGPTCL